MRFIESFVLGFSLFLLSTMAADAAAPPETPSQTSFCNTLDPLSAYPIEQCMDDIPGDGLAGDPDDALFRRLMKLGFEGKSADAISELDDQLARRPLSPALYFIRGTLLQAQGRQSEAIVEFDRALSLEPNMVAAMLQRSWARARTGDLPGAIADTDQALAIAPGFPPVLLNKSLLLIASGEHDKGMDMLDDLIEKSDKPGELLLVRAQLLIADGKTDAALPDLAQVTLLLPDNPQSYLLRADILLRRQDPTMALADISKAIELGSPEPDLLLWRAAVKQRLGDQAGAEEDFRTYAFKYPLRAAEALRIARTNLKPDSAQLTALGMELQENLLRQDIAGAEKVADQLLPLLPGDDRLFTVKAAAAFQRLECDQGTAFIEKIPAEMQNSVPVLGMRSACLINKGRADEAVPFTTKLMEMAPNDPNVLRTHAAAMLTSGRYDDAAAAAKAVMALGAGTPADEAMQIQALNYARKREEAARLAVAFIREHGSDNADIIHVFAEMVFSLERDPTWPLAIELLDAFKPPSDLQDKYDYLMARGQMHQGKTSEALATLTHIKSTDSSLAMSDAEFRPLWNNPGFLAAFDPATSRRRSFDMLYVQHLANPDSLPDMVDLIESLGELGCRGEALAHARQLLKTAPAYKQWDDHGVDAYILAAGLQIDIGDQEAAAKTYEAGLAAVAPLQTGELLLDYARLMAETGQPTKAIILTDLALKRAVTPFGKVIAYGIRAFAFEAAGDAKGRDEALTYLETHWRDNLGAAIDALGLLRSYDGLIAVIGEAVKDPERGRALLRHLNMPAGAPPVSALDKRIMDFIEKLRSDPRVLKEIEQVGRIKPPTYQATCPLTERELTERPFRYPFENASAHDDAGVARPYGSIPSGQ